MPNYLTFRAFTACLLLTNLYVLAIETDQIDDFNTGGANGWDSRNIHTVRTEGGPDGPTDGYLEIRLDVIPFHIGTRNTSRWAGNYLANNVTAIEMDLNRFDLRNNNSRIRLLIFGPGGTFATKAQTPPLAVNLWEHYVFPLFANDLLFVDGAVNDLQLTLSNVTTLLIRNDAIEPALPGAHPPHVLATVGIDNIRALTVDIFFGTAIEGFPGWKASPWYLNYYTGFWP